MHKQSQTFLKELKEDDYFGEIAFFDPVCPRSATARSKDFSECLVLDRTDFLEICKKNPSSLQIYVDIHEKIKNNST